MKKVNIYQFVNAKLFCHSIVLLIYMSWIRICNSPYGSRFSQPPIIRIQRIRIHITDFFVGKKNS